LKKNAFLFKRKGASLTPYSMNDKKDKIDYLTDELMNNLSVDDREHLESWMEESAFHKKFHDLVMRMNFSSQVSAMAEEMRESILLQIHHRIDQAERRSLWLKISAVAASVLILLGATNYFSYYQGYKQLNSQIVEMYNPLGMQSSIVLPDGTKVTLNAGTTLKYPTAFVSKFRKVEVEGEAYFEVAHNEKPPLS
jgi:ferric-dicitrate binding protein FerR (iron transport regulator)